MFTIKMTEEQMKKFEGLVDLLLRTSGLNGLLTAIDLVNVIKSAQPVPKDEQ